MTDDPQIDETEARAAEYALGLMTPSEARAFEAEMAGNAASRAAYAIWVEHLSTLTDDIPPIEPPAAVWTQIERDVNDAGPVRPKTWLQRLGVSPVLAAGLAAAIAFALLIDLPTRPAPFTPGYLAQVAATDGSLIVLAAFDPTLGTLRLERTAGAARPDRVLQLWVIAGDAAPVSLGVLPGDSVTDIPIPAILTEAVTTGVLAISDEPPGGSPTGLPSGDVLATGPVTGL
jgi:anti-sigma-K factor RskA